jgi:hypothetical protein
MNLLPLSVKGLLEMLPAVSTEIDNSVYIFGVSYSNEDALLIMFHVGPWTLVIDFKKGVYSD